jgi:hypothetical protein
LAFHNAHNIVSISITAGQISLGRSLRRTVDLFHSPRDLVEENEHRVSLDEDGEGVDLSEEYVLIPLSYLLR